MELFRQASVEAPVKLSSKGLKNVRMELYEGLFEFVVGDEKYNCSPIIAEFLSPKISRLREADPSVCCYIVNTKDSSSKFKDFLELSFSSELQIAPEDFAFLFRFRRNSITKSYFPNWFRRI